MSEILSMEDVAKQVGRPMATLRFWRHQGTGPRSFKLGGRVVYKAADVEAWIEESYAADPEPAFAGDGTPAA